MISENFSSSAYFSRPTVWGRVLAVPQTVAV